MELNDIFLSFLQLNLGKRSIAMEDLNKRVSGMKDPFICLLQEPNMAGKVAGTYSLSGLDKQHEGYSCGNKTARAAIYAHRLLPMWYNSDCTTLMWSETNVSKNGCREQWCEHFRQLAHSHQ